MNSLARRCAASPALAALLQRSGAFGGSRYGRQLAKRTTFRRTATRTREPAKADDACSIEADIVTGAA